MEDSPGWFSYEPWAEVDLKGKAFLRKQRSPKAVCVHNREHTEQQEKEPNPAFFLLTDTAHNTK